MDKRLPRIAALFALLAVALCSIVATLPVASAQTTTQVAPGCALLSGNIAQQISASEPWYCPINQQIFTQWSHALPLAFAAVVLSFMIAAAIIMFGIATKNEKVRNFGMGELYEAMATGLIVAAFLYICAVSFGLLPSLIVGTGNPYATAFHLMGSTISTSQQLYTSIYNTYFFYDYITTISFSITSPSLSGQGNAANGKANEFSIGGNTQSLLYIAPISIFILDPARAIAIFLVDGMFVLYAEYYALMLFASAAISAFIVPGIILRAIIPTRALGGFMIALGIAFYLIAPTLFSLAFYFTSPTLQSSMQASIAQISKFSTAPSAQPSSISASSPLVSTLQQIPQAISSFWLLALFYPALIIAMCYAFTTQLSRFIGGASRTGSKLRGFI
ncbi:MAG: hypothetical protein KGH66_01120 [Candidatus Micrarchaeota archaeon]|nr:hypothetical protein [Candidatus Micrarchaeota archaeon]